ncbi:unnamed protein product, partial [marine sediment metagenome]
MDKSFGVLVNLKPGSEAAGTHSFTPLQIVGELD